MQIQADSKLARELTCDILDYKAINWFLWIRIVTATMKWKLFAIILFYATKANYRFR